MSDGAGDILPIEDIALSRSRYLDIQNSRNSNLAAQILEKLEDARNPETGAYYHRDNMTLVIAAFQNAYQLGCGDMT